MIETKLEPLPESVLLSCIAYRVREHEGLITFTEETPVWGCGRRMCFEKKCYCWYFTANGDIMASHFEQAYKVVKQYRGDNH